MGGNWGGWGEIWRAMGRYWGGWGRLGPWGRLLVDCFTAMRYVTVCDHFGWALCS